MASGRQATLTLKLIDQVTGPARAVSGALGRLSAVAGAVRSFQAVSDAAGQMGNRIRRTSSDMAGISAPAGFFAFDAAKQIYEFEKTSNAIDAVTDMGRENVEKLQQLATELNAKYPATNVEIMNAALELAKAGMDYKKIRGSLSNTLNLALAGDFDIKESSSILVATATSLRLAMETEAQAAESTGRVADMLAYAANKSLAEIPDLGVTLRYVGAAAASTGLDVEELGAVLATFANNGIMGSNAGTGLRYGLLQLISPSKAASAALAKLNIDMANYVTGAQRINAQDLMSWMELDGIEIDAGLQSSIQEILDRPDISRAPAKLAAAITELLNSEMENGIFDSTILAESLNKNLSVLGTQVDLMPLMEAFRNNPQSEAFFDDIFGKQHAVKWMALLNGDLTGMLNDFNTEMAGAADRMSSKRMAGIVGQWNALTAAVENFVQIIGRTGIVGEVGAAFDQMTKGLDELADMNPELLKLGAYGLLALAAMAPLGWALSGIAGAISTIASPITIFAAALAVLAWHNWDGLISFFDGFRDAFRDFLNPEKLGPTIETLNDMKNAFLTIGEGVDFKQMGRNFGRWTAQLINDIPDFLTNLDGLKAGAGQVLQFLNPLFSDAATSLKAWGKALTAIGEASWSGINQGIANFQDNIKPETVAKLKEYANNIRDLGSAILGFSTHMAGEAEKDAPWYEQAFGGMGTFVANELNQFVVDVETIKTDIMGFGTALSGAWRSAQVEYSWFLMDIRLRFRELVLWIKEVFNIDLGAAGRQMIQTLWDGLKAKFEELIAWARTAGASIASALTSGGGGGVPSIPTSPGSQAGAMVGAGVIKPGTPQKALGGTIGRGWFVAGEKGAELGYAAGPGKIFNAQESRRMMMGGGDGGGGISVGQIIVQGSENPEATARAVRRELEDMARKAQRSRGLSLQDRPEF